MLCELPDLRTEDFVFGDWHGPWLYIHVAGAAAVNAAIRALAHANWCLRYTPSYHYPRLAKELEREYLMAQSRLQNELRRTAAGEWADFDSE